MRRIQGGPTTPSGLRKRQAKNTRKRHKAQEKGHGKKPPRWLHMLRIEENPLFGLSPRKRNKRLAREGKLPEPKFQYKDKVFYPTSHGGMQVGHVLSARPNARHDTFIYQVQIDDRNYFEALEGSLQPFDSLQEYYKSLGAM